MTATQAGNIVAARLFREADILNFDNQRKEAEEKYREVICVSNDSSIYYHLAQGQIYAMNDNLDDAITEFEIARNLDHHIEEVYINLGIVYRKLAGRLQSSALFERANTMMRESIASYRKALEINPNSEGANVAMAMTLLKKSIPVEEVEPYVHRALEVNPQSYVALTALAQIRRLQQRLDDARQLALQAVALKPHKAFAYSLLGQRKEKAFLPIETNPTKALEWLQLAIRCEPDNTFFLCEIAKTLIEMRQYPEAVKYYDRVFEDKNAHKNYKNLTNRGNARMLAGDLKGAEEDLLKSIAIRPDFSFSLLTLRRLYKQQGRYEEACQIAQRLNDCVPNQQNITALKELKSLFEEQKRESIGITRELITTKANPEKPEIHAKIQKALALFSENPDAHGLIARYYVSRKRYSDAKRHFEKALDLNPRAFFYRNKYAALLDILGDPKGAQREYEFVLQQRPEDPAASSSLARLQTKIQPVRKEEFDLFQKPLLVFMNERTGREERHSIELIRKFLYDRMDGWKLPIRQIIEDIGGNPVFIIAKTGVGKTVTVPTKVLLGLCDGLLRENVDLTQKIPQVFVVEPRIPICTMTMAEMNDGYQSYLAYRMVDYPACAEYVKKNGIVDIHTTDKSEIEKIIALIHDFVLTGKAPYNPKHFNLYGCITSATGKINANAPILFVTTGIMESLTFDSDKLDSKYHRIIIDEAHVTIEQNPAIELGISLARKKGVAIDYMSATVDKATLAEDLGVAIAYAGTSRFPIYLSNLGGIVEDHIVDIVENFLVKPNSSRFPDPTRFPDEKIQENIAMIRSHLLSQEDFVDDKGKTHPGLKNRAQGLLVIVNSDQNENSDTRRIADLVSKGAFQRRQKVHVLRLASRVVRDPIQKLAFDRLIHKIEREKGRYVIVATNVVEMGLTFSSLDYVITMDSEFDTTFEDGAPLTQKVALGVNALYQRIGRCGRVRPGMAFIAKDFGASYTELSDEELAKGLREAPIRYPLSKGSFQKLALYSFRESIPEETLKETIADLRLPSRIEENLDLWQRFLSERERLRTIGIAQNDELTDAGKCVLTFIGLEDLYFGRLLAEVVQEYGVESDITIVMTLIAAAAEMGFDSFFRRDFVLENARMLVVRELLSEEALGKPVPEVEELIRRSAGNLRLLYESFKMAGIDSRVSSQICSLLQKGYHLFEQPTSKQEVDMLEKPDTEVDNEDIPLDDVMDDFFRVINGTLRSYQENQKILVLEKSILPFNDQSDLLNIWGLYSYFFHRYFSFLRSRELQGIEMREFQKQMEEESFSLLVVPKSLNTLDKNFRDLCRHIGVHLPFVEEMLENEYQLNSDERDTLAEAILQEILFERIGDDELLDVCRKMSLIGKGKNPDFQVITNHLKEQGFSISVPKVRELWYLVVAPFNKRFSEESKKFETSEMREILPVMTEKLQQQVLEIIQRSGYHRKLVFHRSDDVYLTTVQDQFGVEFEVCLNQAKSPLVLSGDEVECYVKLTPRMGSNITQSTDPLCPGLVETPEKKFQVSHVTLVGK